MRTALDDKQPLSDAICEACRNIPWTFTEPADSSVHPYHLCNNCYERLQYFSLRPREWYNLAILHGWSAYYLHDDFYDDAGIAQQPQMLFSYSSKDNAPALNDVKQSLPQLIDYCLSKHSLDALTVKTLHKWPKNEILQICQKKYALSKSTHIQEVFIQIVGEFARNIAADWIRELWLNKALDPAVLSEASIKSLPHEEAFERITTNLQRLSHKGFPGIAFSCLYLLRSPKVLQWMEKTVMDYSDSWVRLAAVSDPSWPIMHRWISKGRPLSLIALEAMVRCLQNMQKLFRRHMFSDKWHAVISPLITHGKTTAF